MTKVRVGAVQAEPGWLDLGKSVDKTISLIRQAAEDGVNVLGFPEVWIPGYPWFVLPSVLLNLLTRSGHYGLKVFLITRKWCTNIWLTRWCATPPR
jgi:predicted amidohydrolase